MKPLKSTMTASKQRVLRAALVLGLCSALVGLGARVASPAQAPVLQQSPIPRNQIGPSGGACPDCRQSAVLRYEQTDAGLVA
jgi:hypothetical protein